MEFNYYQVLGINQNASDEEIKSAYKMLAKKYHPDKHAGNTVYEEHFKIINSAYQTLSDPQKRQKYDYKLLVKSQRNYSSKKKSTPSQRTTSRPMKKKATPPPAKKTNSKYVIIAVGGMAVFITAVLILSYYINVYTAKEDLKKGIAMEENKNYLQAMENYSIAIEHDQSLTDAYARRGDLLLRVYKNYQSAANDFTVALKSKEDGKWYFKRANCFIKLNKYDEGMRDLNKAIELIPTFDTLYYYRAELNSIAFNKQNEALKDYNKAISLNKKFEDAILGRGLSKQNLGDYQGSIIDFDNVIKINPNKGDYYYCRGYSKVLMHDTASACTDWKIAENLGYTDGTSEMIGKYCDRR